MAQSTPIGTIHLVGAGPGDPDLMTVRAARLVSQARVIVHDGLVDPAILAMARPDARLVSVAKARARHTMPQDAIKARGSRGKRIAQAIWPALRADAGRNGRPDATSKDARR